MRTEDVLAACEAGTWWWDDDRGVVSLDAIAAQLLGLPRREVTITEATLRSCFHVEDYVAAHRVIQLSATESRIGEADLRVVTREGTVVRTVRLRFRPVAGPATGEGEPPASLLGMTFEVPAHPPRPSPEDWDQRRGREAFLLETGQALSEASTVAEVMRVIMALGMPGFTPDGVAVFGREGGQVQMLEYHGREADFSRLRFPMPLDADYPGAEVLRTGRAIYLSTPAEYEGRYPEAWPAIAILNRESWAFLPLIVAGRTIGCWLSAFDYHVDFTVEERALLSAMARLIAHALSRTLLQDTERELTADLQHTMRPSPAPQVPGMQMATRYVPTGGGLQVGGDWYDVIPLPSGRTALVIGDVQGHDVRAAAVMAQLRIALRAYATEGHHPDAILSRASRFLSALTAEEEDPRFATCLYVEVDPRSGTLDIARAGHLDPAMVMEDGTVVIRPTAGSLPLGVLPGSDYPTTRLILQPGETLLLCTDGLLEAGDRDMDTGWARVRKAVEGLSEMSLSDVADTLIETVRAAPPSAESPLGAADRDDIALLLLRRPVAPEAAGAAPVRRMVLTIAQAEPARIADARGQLSALLHDWPDPDRVFGAALMLTEVLGNVLRHTEGDAYMVAEISGRAGGRLLRVEVSDPSDELPHRRQPGELASSGRGLLLMDTLADAWGCAPRGRGKTTWYELAEVPEPGEQPEVEP
ncbi:SpoIIE family protein phosphatase [Streptomyces litchfieldiae]|uniref:SpoIIE family protein phosphatase n=1 Tax=Streptomyces litchfieldiae TaxID=3075543 RepID=A0ABU2MKX9_9ACTN|nr:SpoIIE family protein phosphatase [Streptomyces sp. DSM 44938]MDT0342266.1 SpoIIE family protein phosphatase [Streptomyces sp. DSM 44938]